MYWSKFGKEYIYMRKDTTGKIKPSEQFSVEEKLTFQRRILSIIQEHDIPKELILNLDQTPLSYIAAGKYTFNSKRCKDNAY